MDRTFIPYARQSMSAADITAVERVLRSDWLTTGPEVDRLESAFAEALGVREAIAVNSGTAALHAACHAAGLGPGDEAIVPALTFVATSNAVLYTGATPVFADIDADSLLIDLASVESCVTSRTKAVIAVDYAGQACSYDDLRALCDQRGIALLSDACHAIGGTYRGRPVGSLTDFSTFSLHPAKHITGGEGGLVTTDDPEQAARMRVFRNHGITSDHRSRAARGTWRYEMVELGYNYRLTDFQAALARSQLGELSAFVARRRSIAAKYDAAFGGLPGVSITSTLPDIGHAYHLYVVKIDANASTVDRDGVAVALRERNIGTAVHYPLPHLHPFYRTRLGTHKGLCPTAERLQDEIISLPMYPGLSDGDVNRVIGEFCNLMTQR